MFEDRRVASRTAQVLFQVFESLPRQGPGSAACTARALAGCGELPTAPRILDLGCGSGAQTLQLASLTGGSVVAIDQHPPFIERLRAQAAARGWSARVDARVGDMATLDLEGERFDLVWSEGALYNLGLAAALPLCAGLLRPGGYLAFTDAVWKRPAAPPEVIEAFAGYPTMGRIEDALALIEQHGLSPAEPFELPDAAWWDDYYTPLEARIQALRAAYAGDAEALAALDGLAQEPAMYRRHSHHYGYAFFVARRA